MAQLYPDEHAQALAELRSCSWHVPEHTVAQLIGFDGDVQNLRAWVRKLKMSGMDIAAFNAYEDKTGGDRERWWIIGHLTPKDAGILDEFSGSSCLYSTSRRSSGSQTQQRWLLRRLRRSRP